MRQQFPVGRAAIASGLQTVEWPGRLQVLARQPLVVLDGAHNAASAEVVRHALETDFSFQRLLLVVGLSAGKDAHGVLGTLAPRAERIYLTRSAHERSAPPAELEPLVRAAAPRAVSESFVDARAALDRALADARPDDLLLITGSLFLVGEALEWWRRSHQ